MSAKLIVIDGIDGSGKTTQTKLLYEKFLTENMPAETLKFPQYTNFFGGLVKQYLNNEFGPAVDIDPKLSSVLYAADRWESSAKIKNWLTEEKTVILDRYYTSNLIHQGAKLSADKRDEFISWLEKMEFETFKIPKPDLVIFLHVDAKTSYNLIASRGEGHDGLDTLEHLKKSEESCLQMAEKLNWQTVECCQNGQILPIDAIHQKIWQITDNFLNT